MTRPPAAGELVGHRGRKYLTADERTRFLAAVRAHPKPTVQTLARTLAMTGCRVSEALAIRACDVDLAASELRIATLKRRRAAWRAVPVPRGPGARARARAPRTASPGEPSRPNAAALARHPPDRESAGGRAHAHRRHRGARRPCPRGLRHSFGGSRPSRPGVPLTTIAAVLGHADVSTTALYATAVGAEHRTTARIPAGRS